MIDGVIEHLREAKMPDVGDVSRKLAKPWGDVPSQCQILRRLRCELVFVAPFGQYGEAVGLVSGVAGGEQNAFANQLLQMFVHRLPADSKVLRGDRTDLSRVGPDFIEDKLADIAAGTIVNLHWQYCQPWGGYCQPAGL